MGRPGSPADAAGVRTGDILAKVNDVEIDVRFAEQLPAANQTLFNLYIGRPARVVVRREGRDTPTTVTPTQRPPASSQPAEARAWGMVASDISAVEARDMGRAGTDGVRVLNLRPAVPPTSQNPRWRATTSSSKSMDGRCGRFPSLKIARARLWMRRVKPGCSSRLTAVENGD